MGETTEKFVLSEKVTQEIDRWVTKYPPDQKQSAVITALLLAQEQNQDWLSEPAMDAVAEYLGMPRIAVYEVATFYDMYNLEPIGKHKISVCTNVACMLRGSDKILNCLHKRLGIRPGETSADGLVTLRESECLAACVGAPMCQIDDKHYHENLTEESMLALIDGLAAEGKSNAE